MSSIGATARRLVFPEWVNKAYEGMHPDSKEDLIKAMIYTQIQPVPKGFKISQFVRDGSNRVEILEDIGHCLWALSCTLAMLAWNVMGERKEVKIKEEPMTENPNKDPKDVIEPADKES